MPDYKRLTGKKVFSRNKIDSKSKLVVPKRFFSIVMVLLIYAGFIFAAIFGGYSLLQHLPDFIIKEVTIINQKGQTVSNPRDFFYLDLANQFSLLSFDMERIVQDILARHPELAGVFVRKQFPNKLIIKIRKREPLAIIAVQDFSLFGNRRKKSNSQDWKKLYLVDAEAVILPFQSIYSELPYIIGIHHNKIQLYMPSHSQGLKKALSLLKKLEKSKIYPSHKILQIDVRRHSNILLYLENGVEVKMGQGDFDKKTFHLSKILAQLEANNTVPEYIDMRFDNPIVKP
jgi:cell division septal protein FtsQ